VSPSSWKAQRAVVHSFNRPGELSRMTIPTGVTSPPRDYPSPSIPRHGSLVFHPTEMLYGVGGPDGTGELEPCRFLLHQLNGSIVSAYRRMQTPLRPIPQRYPYSHVLSSLLYALLHSSSFYHLSVVVTISPFVLVYPLLDASCCLLLTRFTSGCGLTW
jgi:hypothetical protein